MKTIILFSNKTNKKILIFPGNIGIAIKYHRDGYGIEWENYLENRSIVFSIIFPFENSLIHSKTSFYLSID